MNQQVLQQQHVDHKITNALLKKGTHDAYKKWNLQDHVWVDMHLHESHNEGALASPTTLSQGTLRRMRQTLVLSPSWALSLALPRQFDCQASTSRIPPPGHPPPLYDQAPARSTSAGLRLHRAACIGPARTAVSRWRQCSCPRRNTTTTAATALPGHRLWPPRPSAT